MADETGNRTFTINLDDLKPAGQQVPPETAVEHTRILIEYFRDELVKFQNEVGLDTGNITISFKKGSEEQTVTRRADKLAEELKRLEREG